MSSYAAVVDDARVYVGPDGFVQATRPGRVTIRHYPLMPAGRRCTVCGAVLSRHNRDTKCWSHTR